MGNGPPIAHFGSFNAQSLSLTVDAFTRSALVIDGMVEGPVAIEQGTHQPTFLPIGILDAAFLDNGLETTVLEDARWHLRGLSNNIFAVDFFEQFNTGLIYSVPWGELGLIVGIALLASFLGALLPAWQAGRITPAEAIRYQ